MNLLIGDFSFSTSSLLEITVTSRTRRCSLLEHSPSSSIFHTKFFKDIPHIMWNIMGGQEPMSSLDHRFCRCIIMRLGLLGRHNEGSGGDESVGLKVERLSGWSRGAILMFWWGNSLTVCHLFCHPRARILTVTNNR